MPHQVIFKKSSVAAKVPLTTDLAYGEVAINYTDGKLYYKTNTNAIKYFVTYDDSVITSKAPLASPVFTGNVTGLGVSTGISFNGITGLSNSVPLVAGTATVGISPLAARQDHVHPAQVNVTGYADYIISSDTRNVVDDPQSFVRGLHADFKANTSDGLSDGGTYHGVLSFRQYASASDWSGGGVRQLGFTDNHNLWIRGANADTTWSSWEKLLHSGNFSSYAPTLTGTGATGSWNINSATATALQTTRLINGSSFNGTANITISEPTFFGGLSAYTTTTPDTVPTNGGFTVRYLSSGATNKPTGTDHSLLTMAYSSAWATQIAGDWRTNEFYVRGNNNGTWSAWDKLYRTNDAATAETASKLALRDSNGDLTTRRFISTIATGTSPLGVTSTTVVTNLNADMLDGQHASAFQTALVSGTNIKTINGATLLGAGDIPVATISDAMAIAIALG
jgi:hypothetical protein